jgi:O-succinylbenzoic acid--CoA ligase
LRISRENLASPSYLDELERLLERWHDSKPYFVVSTSGSTGDPKPINIEKKYMLASAKATLRFLQIPEKSAALLCLPLDKVGGIMMVIRAIVGDLDLVPIDPSFAPGSLEKNDLEFSLGAMVPMQAVKHRHNLNRINNLILGGGPISSEAEELFMTLPNQIWHSYGMTETISHVALRKIGSNNSYFKALPGVHFSVNDDHCLKIEAPYIGLRGLQTKDVVALKGPGEFIWKGRLDNVVLSGGLKLYPEQLESKVQFAKPFFFFGMDHPKLGQQLALALEQDQALDQGQLDSINKQLSPFERPKKWFHIKKIERTANGKIQRKATIAKLFRNC